MIDGELRPIVTGFVAEMLNDPCCESILLDVDEDARIESGLPVLYLDVTGKYHDYILSIVGGKYSGGIRYATGKTRMIVERGTGALWLRKLLDEFRTRLREES
nr:MAG TPA: hypothetical protein [Caudoviricetes sp.]